MLGFGKFKFSLDDIKRILRDTAFAGIGAAGLYLLNYLTGVDFGIFTPIAATLIPVAIGAINRWLRDNNIQK